MPYASTITFTLDTICPWTYLAYLRLRLALSTFRSTHPNSPVTFTLLLAPYQLYPDFSTTGVSKYEWYRDERYAGSTERMDMYMSYMTALGRDEGVEFNLRAGEIANTFDAHRVLHVLQQDFSPAHALLALEALYDAYFCNAANPAAEQTLLAACVAAGLGREEAEAVVGDGERGRRETGAKVREQAGNGIDSVPYVVFEGRKRDFTLVGAKAVGEYVKVMEQVEKEAV
ncbi:thioredoxin-like protein [Phaeosphaeria sp. MPI-PUGE-AT-0046c]|nr:thioredoxin-like protein [Phaeosphaeria sp. MPI-PUGE-AT-0046c]